MVHRLLDVLMQDAWSLTAFVIWRRAKAKSALHLPWRVLYIYQIRPSTASMKITLIDVLFDSLRSAVGVGKK
jgi:hypothetical protein